MNDDAKMAEMAYQFLQRCNLQGHEVPSYLQVVNWLNSKVQPPAPPPTPEEPPQ